MWNGAFSLRKSIGTVTFVPISYMSSRDWKWLDFDNTRTIAQNRIARMIMSGRLRGFFQVLITEKAAKNEYFWPANFDMIDEFAETADPTFFINAPEALTESKALESLELLRSKTYLLPVAVIHGIVILLENISYSRENREELSRISRQLLEELDEGDLSLLMASVMMWELSLEEATLLLDDAPESDEADEIRDWINDKYAELSAVRTRLAAGRGL